MQSALESEAQMTSSVLHSGTDKATNRPWWRLALSACGFPVSRGIAVGQSLRQGIHIAAKSG
jgi:hypothetical protein